MGMIDTVTKEFISDNEVFADIVNFFVFKGEKVVMPSDLVEMDSTAISVPYGTDTSGTPVQEQLKMFSSGLREVMECIKYSEDMHKMREALAENKRFECLDRKTVNVIRYCSNINIDYDNEEVINMCKAFEDYKSEGRIGGKLEGRIEGKLEGKQEMAIQFANYLIAENKSISEIAQLTGLSVEIISGLKNS